MHKVTYIYVHSEQNRPNEEALSGVEKRGRQRRKGRDSVKENNTLCVDVFMKPITKYSDFEPLTNDSR